MPKIRGTSSARLTNLQKEFSGDLISTDNRVLFCGACEKTIGSEKRFQIVQHINTAKHKENLTSKLANNVSLLLSILT